MRCGRLRDLDPGLTYSIGTADREYVIFPPITVRLSCEFAPYSFASSRYRAELDVDTTLEHVIVTACTASYELTAADVSLPLTIRELDPVIVLATIDMAGIVAGRAPCDAGFPIKNTVADVRVLPFGTRTGYAIVPPVTAADR